MRRNSALSEAGKNEIKKSDRYVANVKQTHHSQNITVNFQIELSANAA